MDGHLHVPVKADPVVSPAGQFREQLSRPPAEHRSEPGPQILVGVLQSPPRQQDGSIPLLQPGDPRLRLLPPGVQGQGVPNLADCPVETVRLGAQGHHGGPAAAEPVADDGKVVGGEFAQILLRNAEPLSGVRAEPFVLLRCAAFVTLGLVQRQPVVPGLPEPALRRVQITAVRSACAHPIQQRGFPLCQLRAACAARLRLSGGSLLGGPERLQLPQIILRGAIDPFRVHAAVAGEDLRRIIQRAP